MEYGVNFMLAKYPFHVCGGCNVTLLGREVRATVENARVVERRTVIQFIKRNNIVMLRICER